MLTQPKSTELLFADLMPQAEFEYSIEKLREKFVFVDDCDDLHEFTGATFVIDKDFTFTIKHYKGSDDNRFTIYFSRENGADEAGIYVKRILNDMEIPMSTLKWDRSQGPDL